MISFLPLFALLVLSGLIFSTSSTGGAAEDDDPPAPFNCSCGMSKDCSPKTGKRILGGKSALPCQFPWQVAIFRFNTTFHCGGTLVGEQHVISAAHCFSDGAHNYQVLVGATSLSNLEKLHTFMVPVARIEKHPQYEDDDFDIAVLFLEDKMDLVSFPNIKPACLPYSPLAAFLNTTATVSGWGATAGNGTGRPDRLQHVGVTVMGKTSCSGKENQFCAGIPEGKKDSCRGDSGGPLVAVDPADTEAMSLIGVVNRGLDSRVCGRAGVPGVYADLAYFMHSGWLADQLAEMRTCPAPSPRQTTPTPTAATTPTSNAATTIDAMTSSLSSLSSPTMLPLTTTRKVTTTTKITTRATKKTTTTTKKSTAPTKTTIAVTTKTSAPKPIKTTITTISTTKTTSKTTITFTTTTIKTTKTSKTTSTTTIFEQYSDEIEDYDNYEEVEDAENDPDNEDDDEDDDDNDDNDDDYDDDGDDDIIDDNFVQDPATVVVQDPKVIVPYNPYLLYG